MKRRNGFSLIELLVAMAILVIISGAAVGALVQAQHVTSAVGSASQHTAESSRRDACSGTRPHASRRRHTDRRESPSRPPRQGRPRSRARPGGALAGFFPAAYNALPQITPGWQIGEDAKTVNPVTLAVLDGNLKTDIITVLYADDTLVSSANGPAAFRLRNSATIPWSRLRPQRRSARVYLMPPDPR